MQPRRPNGPAPYDTEAQAMGWDWLYTKGGGVLGTGLGGDGGVLGKIRELEAARGRTTAGRR